MKLLLKAGITSQRVVVFIQDTSSTTGGGLTGLTNASSGLSWYYWREDTGNAGGTSISVVSATRGTFTSGGFIEIDSTNLPGFYELGVPNAVLATGSKWAVMQLKGVTNMAQVNVEVELISVDLTDAVRFGLTALPNAAAEAAGGLYTRGTGAGQVNQSANGQVDTNPVSWKGGTIPTPNVTGEPLVDLNHISGQAIIADSGTAQTGGTTSITLRSGASAVNDKYKNYFIYIDSGTGKGQVGFCTGYNGTTKVATVNGWSQGTSPDSTSTYTIIGF